jgi:hypothetical protein
MKIRVASALLALTLPLFAQDPAGQAEALFYKAFYLEKGPRDFAQAMTLYEEFLAKAPDHKLAGEAAKQQFGLLDRTGKTKERDAFKEKYSKLLGNVVATGAGDAPAAGGPGGQGRGAGAGGDRPARGEGGAGGRPDNAARIAELEKGIEKAKAEGNEEQVKALTAQLERAKAGGGRGQGGPGGARGGGLMRAMMGNTKIADMSAEELTQLKESVANYQLNDRMRQNMSEEQVKKLESGVESLKKALADNKTEDAQKALDALKEAMPRGRGRGGEGAGAGAGGQPPAGGAGGRGGNNGGGNNGGGNRGGGGNNGGGGGR